MSAPTLPAARRRHKYAAINCRDQYPDCPTGHASLKEHRRWQELVLLERAGEIRNLREQVRHTLLPAVVVAGRKLPAVVYVSDFEYEQYDPTWADGWRKVVEDVKGVRTPVYRLKRRLMYSHRDFTGDCPGCPPGAVGACYVVES